MFSSGEREPAFAPSRIFSSSIARHREQIPWLTLVSDPSSKVSLIVCLQREQTVITGPSENQTTGRVLQIPCRKDPVFHFSLPYSGPATPLSHPAWSVSSSQPPADWGRGHASVGPEETRRPPWECLGQS